MATHNSRFQVEFTTDGAGNTRAEILSVGKATQDSAKQAQAAGNDWEAAGQKIGNALRWAGFAAVAGMALVIRNTAKASQEIPQLDAVLKSTGNTATETREQLLRLAEQLADKSTFSTGAIVEAETRLLSYSGIVGDNIPRAMQAVIDQSARLGISLSQSAEIVGRALESPTKAAAALAQQGFGAAFTKEVRDQIKALEQAGKAAEAQQVILGILEESYSGAAESARENFGGALTALGNQLEDLTTGDAGSLPGATKSLNELIELLGSPEVESSFDTITGGVITLTGALAGLIVKLSEVGQAFQDNDEQSSTFLQKRVAAMEAEIKSIQDDPSGIWGFREGIGLSRQPVIDSIRRDMAPLQAELQARRPRVTLLDNGQLPEAALGIRVNTNGGGGSPDPDPAAARAAERIVRAIDSARGIQADWHRELESEGNPILDAYADRLGKIDDQAKAMGRAKVPTGEIAAYRQEMEALAAQIRDKDLAEYQREFAEETEALAAAQGVEGVASAQKYVQAMEEVRKEQAQGAITAELAADRERALAGERDSGAIALLRSLQEERDAVGLNARDYEVYANLKRAGVEADSELGRSISGLTRILQDERDAIGLANEAQAATVGLLVDVGSNWDDAGDAVENFGERMQRVALNLLADKAVQWLFSLLGGGAGAYTGDGTGAGSLAGFGNNLPAFTGTGRASGGGVGGRGAYPVGEGGKPELLHIGDDTWLIPGRDGVVMPAQAAAAGGAGVSGGQGLNLNLKIVKDASEDRVEAAQRPGGFDLTVYVKRAVQGMFRGGDMDGDMQRLYGIGRQGAR